MTLAPENVQDYPRPPALQPVTAPLRVLLGGTVAAETTRGYRVLETHHAPTYYFPPEDIIASLNAVSGTTLCEWKGRARYFDVRSGDTLASRAAWAFEKPTHEFEEIAGYVAFYSGLMEACFVGDYRVTPQPGSFYGGWVTDNLTGVPKGARGTEHW